MIRKKPPSSAILFNAQLITRDSRDNKVKAKAEQKVPDRLGVTAQQEF